MAQDGQSTLAQMPRWATLKDDGESDRLAWLSCPHRSKLPRVTRKPIGADQGLRKSLA